MIIEAITPSTGNKDKGRLFSGEFVIIDEFPIEIAGPVFSR
jgi:hypothetical protein